MHRKDQNLCTAGELTMLIIEDLGMQALCASQDGRNCLEVLGVEGWKVLGEFLVTYFNPFEV